MSVKPFMNSIVKHRFECICVRTLCNFQDLLFWLSSQKACCKHNQNKTHQQPTRSKLLLVNFVCGQAFLWAMAQATELRAWVDGLPFLVNEQWLRCHIAGLGLPRPWKVTINRHGNHQHPWQWVQAFCWFESTEMAQLVADGLNNSKMAGWWKPLTAQLARPDPNHVHLGWLFWDKRGDILERTYLSYSIWFWACGLLGANHAGLIVYMLHHRHSSHGWWEPDTGGQWWSQEQLICKWRLGTFIGCLILLLLRNLSWGHEAPGGAPVPAPQLLWLSHQVFRSSRHIWIYLLYWW